MAKLANFYENTVKSLGLGVEDGFIYLGEIDNSKTFLTEAGVNIVIPTREHLSSLVDTEENEIVKIPFNPLYEDVISKGESVSAKKIRVVVKNKLSYIVGNLSSLLLKLAVDEKESKKSKYELNKFLSSLSVAFEGSTIKDAVDATSVKNWEKIVLPSFTPGNTELIKVFTTKPAEIDGVTYTKVVTIHSPLLDLLSDEKTDKTTSINGVKLRPKDITVFKLVIKFILNEFDKNNVVKIGSNDGRSPFFIAIMQLYIVLVTRTNKIAKLLSKVDPIISSETFTELYVKLEDLNDLSIYVGEVKAIPDERALKMMTKETDTFSIAEMNKRNASRNIADNGLTGEVKNNDPDAGNDIMSKLLGRKRVPDRQVAQNRIIPNVANEYSTSRIYNEAPEYDRDRGNAQVGEFSRNYRDSRYSRRNEPIINSHRREQRSNPRASILDKYDLGGSDRPSIVNLAHGHRSRFR